jgi:hypothetical protein
VVQDLEIRAHNIRYRLERWETPEGKTLTRRLPTALEGRHFGPALVSDILYRHHHCQLTQPLLREQEGEYGIEISAGQVNELLLGDKARFHGEKDALLLRALAPHSSYLSVDDTGTQHQGNNAYVTQIGNACFAWFETTTSKSRINFLQLLRAQHTDYRINARALAYARRRAPAIATAVPAQAQQPGAETSGFPPHICTATQDCSSFLLLQAGNRRMPWREAHRKAVYGRTECTV